VGRHGLNNLAPAEAIENPQSRHWSLAGTAMIEARSSVDIGSTEAVQ
jgi:hypothetical protein